MIKVKILKAEPKAKYKKGDILEVNWAFCNQYGGKEYYHDDRFSWEIPNSGGFLVQHIPLKNCKILSWGGKKPKKKKITIEQLAVNFAGDRKKGAGHGYPSYTAQMLEKGFIAGYKAKLKNK